MKLRLLSFIMLLLGIAAGAQADNLKVGGVELIPGETYTSESGIPALKSGKIIYTEDKVVILENVTLTTYEEKGMDCSVWPELTITLVGNNTIQGATNGIYTERSLNINGTGTLHISECTYGIDNNDMPLTITDAHIKTEGYRLGMRRAGMLHMEGCAILEARGGEGYESIGNISGIDGEGFCVTTPEGGKVKDNSIVDASDDLVKNSWVVIQKKIAINETTFPDANFRSHILAQTYGKDGFLTSEELAGVSYMSLSNKNISNLKGIEHFTALETMACNGNQLASLDVSKQAALILLDCSSNKLTAIDVSQNKKLTELNCSDNELTTLDVTENKALTNLDCAKNQLSVIYVSDDVPLVYLNISKNMMREWYMDVLLNNLYNRYGMENGNLLVCDDEAATGNMMTPDQVAAAKAKGWIPMINDGGWNSYNGALPIDETNFPDENFRNWVLSQDYGKDGYLDDDELAAVTTIDVSRKEISSLKGIELFTALTELKCYSNKLTALDVSQNTALKRFICQSNQLTSLDVSKNTALTFLNCSVNPLTQIDVSNNTALTDLSCVDNQLTSLDVSKNVKLNSIQCYNNSIRGEAMTVLVNSLPNLPRYYGLEGILEIYDNEGDTGNRMTTVQVKIAKDKYWNVLKWDNDASDWVDYEGEEPGIAIDETNFPDEKFRNWVLAQDYGKDGYLEDGEIAAVTNIDVSNKEIASLKGIEFFTALKTLYCNDNKLTSLNVSSNTALTILDCSWNSQIKNLDVTKNTALTYLNCSVNGLTTLDVSENTALNYLVCYNNELTTLNLSNNTALINLVCYGNKLTTLDLSKNTVLEELNCLRNQLTKLDVTNNKALTKVICYNNAIRGEGMTTLVNSLPTVTGGELQVYKNEGDTGNMMTIVQVKVAKDKGWKVLKDEGSGWVDYTGTILASGIAFSAATADATYGADFTPPTLSNPNGVSVTYNSSNGEVATVNGTTGAVSIANAGVTLISAVFAGDGIYEAVTVSYTLTVAKAVPTVTAPVAIAKLVANGSPQALVTAGTTTAGEMQYSLDGSTWSTAIPTATDAGTYTIYYKVVGNKNYEDVAAKTLTVTMAKATDTGLAFSAATADATYGGAFTALTLTNPKSLAVTYKSSKTDVATVNATTGAVSIVGAGTTVISAEFAGNGTYEAATVSYTLTVAKAAPVVTDPVAVANLTANGTAQPLVTAGTTTGGEMQYSLDGSTWGTAIPTATDAGTYTIYYKVVGNKNYEDVAAKTLTVTMAKATVTGLAFSAATADATYGAAFTAPTLSNPNTLSVTYTSSNADVATVNGTTGAVAIVGAGTTIISAVFAGNGTYEAVTVSYTLTVAKAVPTVTAPVAIAKLIANGSPQALVTAGTTTAGEMQYSLDGSTWSTAIPTATEAGSYTVYYKVVGNKNYEDVAAKTMAVTMAKSSTTGLAFSAATADATYGGAFTAPTLTNPNTLRVTYNSSNADVATVNSTTGAVVIAGAGTAVISAVFAGNNIYEAATVSYTLTVAKAVPTVTAPVAVANLIANGTALPLVTAGSTTGGEMQYSLDGSTWSTAIPTATEAGTYTIYYKVVGDKNHEDVATKTLKVTMAKATATGLTFSSATVDATYGADFTAPTLSNPKELSVTYNSSNTDVATVNSTTGAVAIVGAGTTVINAVFAGNGTYEAVTVSYTLTVAKAVPTVTAPVAVANLIANGSAQALVTAGTTSAGEMQYSLDGSTWSTAIPTATEAGSYTVYYKVVGNKNYEDVAAKTIVVTMAKSSATGLAYGVETADATYGAVFTAPTLSNPNTLRVTYSSSNADVATINSTTGVVTIAGAGTAVISAMFAGNNIYEATTVSYTLTVAKAVPVVTAPVAVAHLIANGTEQPLVTAGSTTGGEMQYSRDGSTWSTAIPTATEAGTYTVYYKVVGDRNYEDVATTSLKVTVAASAVEDDVEVGDANGDGTIDAADIMEVMNYIMGRPSEEFKEKGADANEDGVVNAADIVKIVNMITE